MVAFEYIYIITYDKVMGEQQHICRVFLQLVVWLELPYEKEKNRQRGVVGRARNATGVL